jgi:hypothetical protein
VAGLDEQQLTGRVRLELLPCPIYRPADEMAIGLVNHAPVLINRESSDTEIPASNGNDA